MLSRANTRQASDFSVCFQDVVMPSFFVLVIIAIAIGRHRTLRTAQRAFTFSKATRLPGLIAYGMDYACGMISATRFYRGEPAAGLAPPPPTHTHTLLPPLFSHRSPHRSAILLGSKKSFSQR